MIYPTRAESLLRYFKHSMYPVHESFSFLNFAIYPFFHLLSRFPYHPIFILIFTQFYSSLSYSTHSSPILFILLPFYSSCYFPYPFPILLIPILFSSFISYSPHPYPILLIPILFSSSPSYFPGPCFIFYMILSRFGFKTENSSNIAVLIHLPEHYDRLVP